MKLVIIGGSSQSTPALFLASEIRNHLESLEITLMGRRERHLAAVARAVRVLTGDEARVRLASFENDLDALKDADVVLIQARFGGYHGRNYDERFPLAYGIPGDEGLGPGGLASACDLGRICESCSGR